MNTQKESAVSVDAARINPPLRLNIAADINRLHEMATYSADQAVDYAKQAGVLLLEAKAALKHGEWLPWLEINIFVTPRQVQRYMQAALGRPMPARAISTPKTKSDTVSYLPDWMPRPSFIPIAGNACWCSSDDSDIGYVVEPSSAHPGFFFLSHFIDEGCTCVYLTKPIRADFVETWLKSEGLADPARAKWRIEPCDGVSHAGASIGIQSEAA